MKISKILVFFIIVLLLKCNNSQTQEQKIAHILSGKKRIVWNIYRNEWDMILNCYRKTSYGCEFNKDGFGYYILMIQGGIRYVSNYPFWELIDTSRIVFNYDTLQILYYNDTLFRLKSGVDTFYLVKHSNQKREFYDVDFYIKKKINKILNDR
jgi:hypothetical protein